MTLQKYDLTTEELMLLQSELKHEEKSIGLAYLMLLGGHLGLHRFYLRQFGTGVMQLVLFLFTAVSYFSLAIFEGIDAGIAPLGVSFVMLLLFGIPLFCWLLADLINLGGMVRTWNKAAEDRLLANIEEIRLYRRRP